MLSLFEIKIKIKIKNLDDFDEGAGGFVGIKAGEGEGFFFRAGFIEDFVHLFELFKDGVGLGAKIEQMGGLI